MARADNALDGVVSRRHLGRPKDVAPDAFNINLRQRFVAANAFPAECLRQLCWMIARSGVFPVTVRNGARRAIVARRACRAARALAHHTATVAAGAAAGGAAAGGASGAAAALQQGAGQRAVESLAYPIGRGGCRGGQGRRRSGSGSRYDRCAPPIRSPDLEARHVFREIVPHTRGVRHRRGQLQHARRLDVRRGQRRTVARGITPVNVDRNRTKTCGELDIRFISRHRDAKVFVETAIAARDAHRPRRKRCRVARQKRVGDVRAWEHG